MLETTETIAPDTAATTSEPDALQPLSFYVQHCRKKLPAALFEPVPARFFLFIGFLAVAITALTLISLPSTPWYFKAVLGFVAGSCFGGIAFFSHELLHGSVVRSRKLQDIIGFFGFMPFFISPTFWRFWHNHLHHGNTQAIIADPDAYPTLRIYKHSKFSQNIFPYTPGSRYLRSYFYFFFWFSFHSFYSQVYLRSRNAQFDRMNHRKVTLEFVGQIVIWCSFLYWLGPQNLVWTFVIPFMVQNYITTSYTATNHNLSPLTKINDPLVNSLTVTGPAWIEWLHWNFGYHVEHHICPTVNPKHVKTIHNLLKEDFPQKFRIMKKSKALVMLYKTARIYKNSKTLVHPETGETYPTI
jgi:fatty acid desaturase